MNKVGYVEYSYFSVDQGIFTDRVLGKLPQTLLEDEGD